MKRLNNQNLRFSKSKKWDSVGNLDYGLKAVSENGKWGVVNAYGELTVPCEFDAIYDFADIEVAHVRKNDKYGFINEEGELSAECIYDWIGSFRNCLALVEKDGKYGCIDSGGFEVIEPVYDSIGDFDDNYCAIVVKNGKCGVITESGYLTIPCEWDDIEFDSDSNYNNFYHVEKNGKWGLMDENNLVVAPPLFNSSFSYIYIGNKEYDIIGDIEDSISIEITEEHRIESQHPYTNKDSATLFYNDEVVLTDNLEAIVNMTEFLGFSH